MAILYCKQDFFFPPLAYRTWQFPGNFWMLNPLVYYVPSCEKIKKKKRKKYCSSYDVVLDLTPGTFLGYRF